MTCLLEYHSAVQRWIAPTVALFGSCLLFAVLVPSGHGQTNGVPASVTSAGFGGRAVNGTPPSVTSFGTTGVTPHSPQTTGVQFFTSVPMRPRDGDRDHHRHHQQHNFFPGGVAVYPVPVAVPYAAEQEPQSEQDADAEESEYQGGPTIFDRRGRGEEAYVPPMKNPPPAHADRSADSPAADPAPPQDPTFLVFKDGRELEVVNYAIVGQTLFDLTPGHARKVALAELDLDATQKKNDEHGVTFQLPPGPVPAS